MTPKEKAKELVDKMYYVDFHDDCNDGSMQYKHAVKCALIAVNEILKVVPRYYNDEILTIHGSVPFQVESCSYEFYNKVKQEIEKL